MAQRAAPSFPYGAPAATKPIGAMGLKDPNRTLSAQKLNPNKCANPFQTNVKACKTTFSQSYVSGSIPCRLQSSCSRYSLQWDANAQGGFSPDLLIVCADGLSETQHPYSLMAPMMFHELVLRAEGCLDMFAPIMEPVVAHLRKAMSAKETFTPALAGLQVLVANSGNLILPHLPKLVMVMSRAYGTKEHRDAIGTALGEIEMQCGPDATKMIKSKIPTWG